jgi:hypothetical protein
LPGPTLAAMDTWWHRLSIPIIVGAAASAGAGAVHVGATVGHDSDPALVWLFAACAAAQLSWAALVVIRPSRGILAAGAMLNGGAFACWALSRTVGLIGPLAGVESVGTQDLVAAGFGALAAGAAAAALLGVLVTRPATLPAVAIAGVLVLVLAVPAMATTHTHDHEHAHDVTGDHDHHVDGHAGHEATEHEHADPGETGPIVSLDDPRLTKDQEKRAEQLLDTTRAALTAFPDEASVVAAGYQSIGDGRRPGTFEHFVNAAFTGDGHELNAAAIESIVLQVQPDGSKTVASAMYIMEPGTTMETVPDVAGELTPWHDHQNLCFAPNGRLAGRLVNGTCVPGGTLRLTAPMMHVWLADTPCGPFSGIEGHGGNCQHAHHAA